MIIHIFDIKGSHALFIVNIMSETDQKQFCQKMTTREMEHQSKIATQKALLELSIQTEEDVSHITSSDEDSELLVKFDMRDFFREYCDVSLSEDKKKLKVFHLLHQNAVCFNYIAKLKQRIGGLNQELENQRETEEYQEEESERYIKELDEKDMEISKLTLRVTKLREKCIAKNRSLFWWNVTFITSQVAWLGWFIYQNYGQQFSAFIF